MTGSDSPSRESNPTSINNAIKQLTHEIIGLETLLGEIQGGPPLGPEVASAEKEKEAVPSVMETMTSTASRIHKLTERISIARNMIRESLF